MLKIQIIIIAFLLFASYKTFSRYRLREINGKQFFIWVSLWILAGIVILIPGMTSSLAQLVGITRGVDLVVYTSIVVLFYLIFKIFTKFQQQERQITRLVRSLALREKKDK